MKGGPTVILGGTLRTHTRDRARRRQIPERQVVPYAGSTSERAKARRKRRNKIAKQSRRANR